MAKIYMVRHQHHGVFSSVAFAETPTQEQQDAIKTEADRIHGREGWVMVVEAPILGSEVPEFPKPRAASADGLTAPLARMSATGTVEPAK